MADTTTTVQTDKAPKKSFFKGITAEFKKVIWPDKQSVGKQTVAVIVTTIILGLVIALIDAIIKLGVGVII